MLRNFKSTSTEMLHFVQHDSVCHSEQSEESNLFYQYLQAFQEN